MVKQKSITLDRANDKVFSFHNMKTMVLNTTVFYELDSEGQQEWLDEMHDRCLRHRTGIQQRHQFKWDNKTKDITTKSI